MGKIIRTLTIVSATIMLLTGCGITSTGNIITEYTDGDTKCEYLVSGNGGMVAKYELVDGELTIKGCEEQ